MLKIGLVLLAVGAILTATALPISAEQLSTRQLLDFCSSRDVFVKNGCKFYILGVVEGADTTDGTSVRNGQFVPGRKTIMCIPEGVTGQDMIAAYVQVMSADTQVYPDDLNLPAVSSVMSVMSKRYPCR